eukprot:scaffold112623_cov105-Phaeocystis_antarctica.AAC.3
MHAHVLAHARPARPSVPWSSPCRVADVTSDPRPAPFMCPVVYHTRTGAPARQRERLPARHLDGADPRVALLACFQSGRPRTRARGTATSRAQRDAARDRQPHLGLALPLVLTRHRMTLTAVSALRTV